MTEQQKPPTYKQRYESELKRRRTRERKAAVTNRENDALKREIRNLRHTNFIQKQYLEDPVAQTGYKHRYERLQETHRMLWEILDTQQYGYPLDPPTTLEPDPYAGGGPA